MNDRLSMPEWQSLDWFTALNETTEQLNMCETFHTMHYLILLSLYQGIEERLSLFGGSCSLFNGRSQTLVPTGLAEDSEIVMPYAIGTTSNMQPGEKTVSQASCSPNPYAEYLIDRSKMGFRSQLNRRILMKAFATLSTALSVFHLRFNEDEIGRTPELDLIQKLLQKMRNRFGYFVKVGGASSS